MVEELSVAPSCPAKGAAARERGGGGARSVCNIKTRAWVRAGDGSSKAASRQKMCWFFVFVAVVVLFLLLYRPGTPEVCSRQTSVTSNPDSKLKIADNSCVQDGLLSMTAFASLFYFISFILSLIVFNVCSLSSVALLHLLILQSVLEGDKDTCQIITHTNIWSPTP